MIESQKSQKQHNIFRGIFGNTHFRVLKEQKNSGEGLNWQNVFQGIFGVTKSQGTPSESGKPGFFLVMKGPQKIISENSGKAVIQGKAANGEAIAVLANASSIRGGGHYAE